MVSAGVLTSQFAQTSPHRAFIGAVFGNRNESGFINRVFGLAGFNDFLQTTTLQNELNIAFSGFINNLNQRGFQVLCCFFGTRRWVFNAL